MGDQPDYITGLRFELSEGDQADPGRPTLTEEHKETAQHFVDE